MKKEPIFAKPLLCAEIPLIGCDKAVRSGWLLLFIQFNRHDSLFTALSTHSFILCDSVWWRSDQIKLTANAGITSCKVLQ